MTETIKREITPELQRKLIGILPVSKKTGVPYTPKMLDIKELKDHKPLFYQRGWTEEEVASVEGLKEDSKVDFNALMRKVTACTILGMQNLFDISDGSPINYVDGKEGLSEDVFRDLPVSLQLDLFQHAKKISGIGIINHAEQESLE